MPICVLIILNILRNEIKKRKLHEDLNKWFYIGSNATFLTLILSGILSVVITIPTICKYIFPLYMMFLFFPRIALTFYQIIRLQYCFSSSQTHSSKYGYNKWLFVVLYIWGVIVAINYAIIGTSVFDPVEIGDYGCTHDERLYTEVGPYILTFGLYIIWDLLVLILYGYKIWQIHQNTSFNDDQIYRRIRGVLYKIALLTIVYEVIGMTFLVTTAHGNNYKNVETVYPVQYALSAIDMLVMATIVYLMIEHNDEEYQKLMRVCFGYKCLRMDSDEQNMVGKDGNVANKSEDTADTRTANPVETQMTTQINSNIELSVED